MWTLFIEHTTLQPMAVLWKREAPCCWMLGCVWEYSFHPHTNPSGCAVGSSLWAGVVYSSRCGCSLQRSLPEGYTTHMGTAPVAMCTISSQQVFLAMFSEATTIGCCASQWEVCIEAHGLVMFERRGQFMVGGLVVIWSVCLLFCCQRDFSACCVFFVVSLCFWMCW